MTLAAQYGHADAIEAIFYLILDKQILSSDNLKTLLTQTNHIGWNGFTNAARNCLMSAIQNKNYKTIDTILDHISKNSNLLSHETVKEILSLLTTDRYNKQVLKEIDTVIRENLIHSRFSLLLLKIFDSNADKPINPDVLEEEALIIQLAHQLGCQKTLHKIYTSSLFEAKRKCMELAKARSENYAETPKSITNKLFRFLLREDALKTSTPLGAFFNHNDSVFFWREPSARRSLKALLSDLENENLSEKNMRERLFKTQKTISIRPNLASAKKELKEIRFLPSKENRMEAR